MCASYSVSGDTIPTGNELIIHRNGHDAKFRVGSNGHNAKFSEVLVGQNKKKNYYKGYFFKNFFYKILYANV